MMADACCGPDETTPAPVTTARGSATVRHVRELGVAAGSGVLLLAGWLWPDGAVGTTLTWLALLVGAATFVPGTVRALLRGRLGVGLLMTVAATGAVLLGELGEAATLAFLFAVAEGLEGYAVARTRRGLSALLDLVPTTARVLRPDGEAQVRPDDLVLGDLLVVRPGERIATDGVVRAGRSALDTALVTGESVPVEVGPGETVWAGTINGAGALEVEVTATTEDGSLARLVRVVHEAQTRKGGSQRLAERFARPLVPGVLVLAALVAVVGSLLGDPAVWVERALVVLVAAAPCAFALSVPVAVVAAIGAASRAGVLVKGGAGVEALGAVRTVALDKTGTLTRNEPEVVGVVPAPGHHHEDVLAVAAALESRSEHPLAAAVLSAHGAVARDVREVEAVPGHGVRGVVDGAPARLGRPGWVEPGACSADVDRFQDLGATVVLVERDAELLGLVAVRDELRPEAAEAVATLRRRGLRVVMLTGDAPRTAAALAAEAGIDDVRAGLLPEDKARIVTGLRQHGPVAMVGDGINDAPALATADAGIAMGAMGSDVAVEAADVALLGEDLRRLPDAVAHARAARRILTQNLVLSGAILVALVPLAGLGVLSLAAVVATHELAEVLVILNGVRAGRRRLLPTRAPHAPAPTVLPVPVRSLPVLAPTGCGDGCRCCRPAG